ncbi:bacteriocin transporter [Erysipelothrix rhusiopathiae]|nr:bacteriocin transporter [Erysipelothrix rhusiopathiae]
MSSKITRVFTSVFIVFIVMFSILLVSAQQETMLNDIFKSGSYKSIYIPDTAKISRDEFMSIIGSAQKKHVYFGKYSEKIRYVSVNDFSTDVKEFLGVRIPPGTLSLSTFETNKNHDFYVKPLNIGSNEQLELTFKKLDESILDEEVYGFLDLYAKDQEQAEVYIEEIAQRAGLDADEIVQQKTISSDAEFFFLFLMVAIVIFSISNMLVTIFSFVKRNKEIGVYKLLGLSDFSVAKKGISKYISWYIVFSVIVMFMTSLIMNYWNIYLIKIQITYLSVYLLASIILIITASTVITRKYSIASLTKNQKTTNAIIRISMVSKVLFTIILGYFLLNTTNMLESLTDQRYKLSIFENYRDTYAFTSYAKNRSDNNSTSNKRVPKGYPEFNYSDFYQKVIAGNNGYYVDFSAYSCPDETNERKLARNCYDDQYIFALVNDIYINDYKLLPMEQIKNALKEEKRVILIPRELQDSENLILQDYSEYFQSTKTIVDDLQMESIIYEDSDFFSMNSEVVDSDYLIHNPILIVFDENTVKGIPDYQLRFFGYGTSTAAQFSLDSTETKEAWYKKNEVVFKQFNIENNISVEHFINTSNDLNIMISILEFSLKIYTGILLISILLISFVSFNITHTYMSDIRKEIFVRKLIGESDFNIFKQYILLLFFTDLLAVVIVTVILPVFLKTTISIKGIGVLFLLIIMIDVIVFSIVKSKFVRNNSSNQIKGE